jgi:DNA-directed RNA polymerase subunit L
MFKETCQVLAVETEKDEEKQDKTLINQLSKTIAESSKVLSEFGMAPPMVSHMKDMISVNYFNSKNEDKEVEEEIRNIRNQTKNAKSAFFLSRDNEDDNKNKYIDSVESEGVF